MFVVEVKGNKYVCETVKVTPLSEGRRILLLEGVVDEVGVTWVGELEAGETFIQSNWRK